MRQPGGICFSRDGKMMFITRGLDKSEIIVTNVSEGRQIRTFACLTKASGICTSSSELFFSDPNHCINVLDISTGETIRSFGSHGNGPGQFMGPKGMCLSKDGKIFVADSHNHRIQVFNAADGTFLQTITGTEKGFWYPQGVCLSPDEKELMISDIGGLRVMSVNMENGIQSSKYVNKDDFAAPDEPSYICVSPDGRFIAVSGKGLVHIMNINGERARTLKIQSNGVCFSPNGEELFVTDFLNNATRVFQV